MNEQRRTRLEFDADLNVTRIENPPAPQIAEPEFVEELMAYLADTAA